MTRAAPYPADVRAKGWRFELDHEKIEQSDTWALAPAELKPWLLMLWLTAWKQTPCGSLPDDDDLIAARIGMPAKLFQKHRAVLRRGWWAAEDRRLYHDTIVEFVRDMMMRRRKESDRKAMARARIPAVVPPDTAGVPPLSHGTDAGLHRDSDTGTGTGTSTQVVTPTTGSTDVGGGVEIPKGTKAGEVCRAIKLRKIQGVSPGNPELQALIAQGVELETFEAAADICAKSTPPKGLNYLLGIVRRQLGEAATIAAGPGVQAGPWDATRSSIEAKAAALGLEPWKEHDISANRETFPAFTARVRRAVEQLEGEPA